jgi:5-methylcytosine-specific restriction protein A
MPRSPGRPRSTPNCWHLVPCPLHVKRPWRRPSAPGSTTARGYGWSWQQLRRQVLAEEPACRLCGAPSTDVDHIIPKAQGGTDAPSNLRALCAWCHKRSPARRRAAAR